jgi:hypothetical protein
MASNDAIQHAAMAYAKRGKAVFPCRLDKRPFTAHGLKDATSDPEQVEAFWEQYPGASIGLPTGPDSGLWVLDIDLPDGPATLATLEQENGPLPPTLEQQTGSGGRQLFWEWNGAEIRNSAGKLGPGVDVRGTGGYCIVPPSPHPSGNKYHWKNTVDPAPAPGWLVDLIISTPAPSPAAIPPRLSEKTTPYGSKALQDEAAKVALAQVKTRNQTLFNAALALGNLVAGGHVDQEEAQGVLLHAATRAGLTEREATKTIESGLAKGLQAPRGPEPCENSQIRKRCEPSAQGETGKSANFANSQEEDWKDVLSIPEWPTLDDAAMPGAIGEFVDLASRNSEADPAAILATLLVRFAAECGPESFFRVGDSKHYPRLNAVICGISSKGRKGTSYGPVRRLFKPLNDDVSTCQTSPGPLSTGEGLIFRVRDERKQWITDKKTGEGRWEVVDPGEPDKRLFVCDQELAAALQAMRRQGNTLSTIVRSLWDTGTCDPLTKSNPIRCSNAHVNIVAHITIAELRKLLAEIELLNGLANRFAWFLARRGDLVPFPEPMPRHELDPLRRLFMHNAEKARQQHEMTMTEDAKALWIATYPELSKDHGGMVGSILNRGEVQVLRLSMVYALAMGDNRISEQHIKSGLAVWDYCQASTTKIFMEKTVDELQCKILAALEQGPLDTTALHRAFHNHVRGDDLKAALKELTEGGKVVAREERKEGQRARVIFSLANLRTVRKARKDNASRLRNDCEVANYAQASEPAPAPDVEVF